MRINEFSNQTLYNQSFRIGFPGIRSLMWAANKSDGTIIPKSNWPLLERTLVPLFTSYFRNVTWVPVDTESKMRLYKNGSVSGVFMFLKHDFVDVLCYPYRYVQEHTHYGTHTNAMVSESASVLVSFIDPQSYGTRKDLLLSFNVFSIHIYVLQALLMLLVFFALVLHRHQTQSCYDLILNLICQNVAGVLTLKIRTFYIWSLLLTYTVVLCLIRSMVRSMLKTQLVTIDDNIFIDTIEDIRRHPEIHLKIHNHTSFATNLHDRYSWLTKQAKVALNVRSMLADLAKEPNVVSIAFIVLSSHNAILIQHMCAVLNKTGDTSLLWASQPVKPVNLFLWFAKKLEHSHRILFDIFATLSFQSGLFTHYMNGIYKEFFNKCHLPTKDSLLPKIMAIDLLSFKVTAKLYILMNAATICIFIIEQMINYHICRKKTKNANKCFEKRKNKKFINL